MAKKRIVPVEFQLKGDKDLKQFNKSLRSMDASLKKSTKSLKTMESTSKKVSASLKLVGAAVIGMIAKQGFQKLTSVVLEFEKTMARLETLEGSADGAAKAFEKIQKFATTTPFTLDQTTEAFITLKNFGLDPGEAALTSYGNTASAMGKNIADFSMTVAKAVTGEMESLKLYGIIAKQQGDKVAFTFRGVETVVAKTSTEIQGYLRSIGDINFAGAMELQLDDLGTAFSNLGIAYDDLFRLKPEEGVTEMSEAVNTLNAAISDPAFKDSFQGMITSMVNFGTSAATALVSLSALNKELKVKFGITGDDPLVEMYKQRVALEERISRGGITGLLQNTDALEKNLVRLNAQIKLAEEKQAALDAAPAATTPAAAATPAAASTGGGFTALKEENKETLEFIRLSSEAASYRKAQAAAIISEANARRALAESITLSVSPLATYEAALREIVSVQDLLSEQDMKVAIEEAAGAFKEATATVGEFEAVLIDGFTSNFDTMINGVLQGTQTLSDGFKDMAKVIIAELLKIAAYKTIMSAFGGTDFGASFGASSGATAWASGGIVKGPMMASGNNLIGERGEEGLLPLTRNSKGDLSVSTDGGGGGGMNVTVNNNAPVQVSTTPDGNGGLTIEIIEQAIAGRIAQGGNAISDSMQNSFGLNRGLGAR